MLKSPVTLVTPEVSGPTPLHHRRVSTANVNAANVKAGAGRLLGVQITNVKGSSAAVFLKLYDKATSPTVGTDTILKTLACPSGQSVNFQFPMGIYFSAGISLGITADMVDSSTTGVGAADCIIHLDYV